MQSLRRAITKTPEKAKSMNEQEQFLESIKEEKDVLSENIEVPEATEPEKETEAESELQARNRRERRLLEQSRRYKEEAIAAEARLQGIKEAQTLRQDTPKEDYLTPVEKIYGNATPEAKEATELLKEALRRIHDSAKMESISEVLESIKKEREEEFGAVAKEEDNLDEMLNGLEDSHNVDFSNETTRKGFLSLLERASPKDREGNIIEYADAETVYELYESAQQKSSRAKELAGRSMTRGGAGESKLEISALERTLKEQGII